MKDEISDLLLKAKQSLEASALLLDEDFYDFSASRAYYAMFYIAEASLLKIGKVFSKHSAVIASFGKEFVKTGIFPQDFHQNLIEAFELRQTGDYGVFNSLDRRSAVELIEKTKIMINAIDTYLNGI